MAGKFNINQLLGGASAQGDESAEQQPSRSTLKVTAININKLIPSSNNFYSVDNISELKNSIERLGVLQNLTVKPLDGGNYEIIAGHRRYKACAELFNEGKPEFEYIPCVIIQAGQGEINERVLMIESNSTTRELTEWEKMKQAAELTKYYTALKQRDNLPGRVRDLVAEALNMSATQVGRMSAINNNLAPELKSEFQEGRLGMSAAYELSSLPEDAQKEALADLQEKGGLSINDARAKRPEVSYPESPPEPEAEEGAGVPPEKRDFADMSAAEKAELVVRLLNQHRFTIFKPGQDTRVFDFIIEAIEFYGEAGN